MKLQDQVCTLDQAKRLKELGVIQGKSYAAYIKNSCQEEKKFYLKASNEGYDEWETGCLQGYSAFTVAELGLLMQRWNMPFYWPIWEGYCFKENGQPRGYGSEAVARAALLIHLLESNKTTAEEVNKRLEA